MIFKFSAKEVFMDIKTTSIHERMQVNFEKLHAQIIFWKPHNIFALCWAFYCVNDNKKVNGKAPRVIYCMLCYNSRVDASNLMRIQVGKE